MRKRLFCATLLFFLAGKALPLPAAGGEPPAVAASIYPLADLLARIAGDDFRASSIYEAGMHPRKAGAPRSSLPPELALYVRVGGSLEGTADVAVQRAARRVLELEGSLDLMEESPGERVERSIFAAALGADAGETKRRNPWFWLAPPEAADAVELMAAALAELRPGAAEGITKRSADLKEKLLLLDREIARLFARPDSRTFAVFTTSWSYFARRYNLQEVLLSSVTPGGGPGRHSLKGAAARLRETGTRRAFTDLMFPAAPAEAIAAMAGSDLVVLHPLGRAGTAGGYFSLMKESAHAVSGDKKFLPFWSR